MQLFKEFYNLQTVIITWPKWNMLGQVISSKKLTKVKDHKDILINILDFTPVGIGYGINYLRDLTFYLP